MNELVVYVVGTAWVVALAVARVRGPFAVLAGLMVLSWLATLLLPSAVLWHRGLLVHLLLAGGAWLPRSWVARTVVAAGYAAALMVSPWILPWAAPALAAAIPVAAAVEQRRHWVSPVRAGAWRAATALTALAFAVPPLLAVVGLSPSWGTPVLVGYAATQVLIAALLVSAVRPRSAPWAIDVAVELGAAPRERLVRALATTIRDPRIVIEQATTAQAAAEVLHDRLAARQKQLAATIEETEQSRRRLEVVDSQERLAIRRTLDDAAVTRLQDAVRRLAALHETRDASGSAEPILRALHHLRLAIVEMDGLGQGLAPEALAAGLGPALSRLAATTPGRVSLEVPDESSVARLRDEVAACVYYVAAEALANVVKHAEAGAVLIRLTVDDPLSGVVELVVADDGRGMHDASGSGLAGLRVRAEDVGGRVEITSRPGRGTQIRLTAPLREVVAT